MNNEELITFLKSNRGAKLLVDRNRVAGGIYYCELHNNNNYCVSYIDEDTLDILRDEGVVEMVGERGIN